MIGEDAKQILRRLMTFIMGLPVDERTYPLAFLVELRKMISSRNFNLGKEIDQNQFINTYGKIKAPMGDASVFFNFLQEVAQEFNLPLGCVNHVFLIVMTRQYRAHATLFGSSRSRTKKSVKWFQIGRPFWTIV